MLMCDDDDGGAAAMVTGAAGFIGSHLAAALLAQGRDVIGIDNFDPFYDRSAKLGNIARVRAATAIPGTKPGQSEAGPQARRAPARVASPITSHTRAFEMIEADIRDRERMAAIFAQYRPNTVFHIGALAGVRPSIADPARYASVNIDGLVSVLDAARAAGCRHVVFASSSSVYGNNRKVPFAETDAVDEPISPYAATKRAGELICHTYAHLFGMRIAALRFFTVFGPAQRPDLAISSFMRKIATGDEVPMFGDGTTSRDYTYIDDIIEGVLAAESAAACGEARPRQHDHHPKNEALTHSQDSNTGAQPAGFFRIWNLGGSHPITLREMIATIARIVGRPAKIKRLPMQPGDVERTFADITRSKAELRFQPRTSFEDGVQKQWDWLHARICEPAV